MLPGDPWVWLLVVGLAALFNATPVLAPPTWAVLAWFGFQYDIPVVPLAIAGAAGSTAGRLILALASRWLGMRLIPARRRADAERAAELLRTNQRLNLSALALFAVGPVPKAMLFMAAGIARVPLAPGAIAYGIGRTAIYLVALSATSATVTSFGDLLTSGYGGPLMIAAQVASVAGVFLLFRMDLPALARRLRPWSPLAALRRARPARPQHETP